MKSNALFDVLESATAILLTTEFLSYSILSGLNISQPNFFNTNALTNISRTVKTTGPPSKHH